MNTTVTTTINETVVNDVKAVAAFPPDGLGLLMADGGLETTLLFHDGLELPDFAAFPLVASTDGRAVLTNYYQSYLSVAAAAGAAMVVDTPTWRANLDWGTRLGYSGDELTAANIEAVDFVRHLGNSVTVPTFVNGVIGPRGDGYVVGEAMSADEAARYHSLQTRAFAAGGVDVITAVTMTYCAEAVGIVEAAKAVGRPVIISFTVETDGCLPSGQALGDAIKEVDEATDNEPVFYMINCAHPSHFIPAVAAGDTWIDRVGAVRANASKMSHEELDNAEELDRGDVMELASDYRHLQQLLPNLRIVGGCCGTDHAHIETIVAELSD